MPICYISVGSNIEPEKNIIEALNLLQKKVKITSTSTFYVTKPIGNIIQPDYLNGVWEIETEIPPKKLKFKILRKIEKKLKRKRTKDKYAPRTIDLDLILYNNLVLSSKKIKLPDEEIYKRNFIALPLYELNKDIILPDTNLKIIDIVKKMKKDDLIENLFFTEKLKKIIKQGE